MLEQFSTLWALLQSSAPEAVVNALIVFISILVLRALTLIPTSNWARAANIVFSVLLSGVTAHTFDEKTLLLITMTSAFSATVWEVGVKIVTWIGNNVPRHLPAIIKTNKK